jgi:two-component SAPR family response regulator
MEDTKAEYYCCIQKSIFIRICLLIIFLSGLFSQDHSAFFAQHYEYGLGFFGSDAVKDKRTKLDLNHSGYYSFSGEFELSFFMQLQPSRRAHFGYVARIIDKDNNNIDVIYNGPESNSLQIIYGQELTDISIPDVYPGIFDSWTELRLKVNLKNRSIQFSTPDTTLVDPDIDLNGKVKIFFGASDFEPIKTTDVPAMRIKDIRIFVKDKCRHHFPLDESAGSYVDDLISKKKAFVHNPRWIKPVYYNWSKAYSAKLKGFAAITYDYRDEKIYMIGEEKINIYSVAEDDKATLIYDSDFEGLQPGSQAFFDTISNSLLCYNLLTRTVYTFNNSARIWVQISQGSRTTTSLWSHNKFYSNTDSTLYILGGYGQHKYSNTVQRYNLANGLWDTLTVSGDKFLPRRNAALGHYRDTLFILGGFGSASGDAILKPHHHTDLLAFSINDGKFTKKYDFKAPLKEIDFTHSMVLDPDERSYYVLASTIYAHESYLQLLKGSLEDPELMMLGNRIPYIFDNENSYSDLYYSSGGEKLIAVTLLANPEQDETGIDVYTIAFPPHIAETETTEVNGSPWRIVLPVLLVLLIFLAGVIIWYLRRKGIAPGRKVQDGRLPLVTGQRENGKKLTNSILFFGGFQIINKDGEDITSKFTPLLKELFLLIFLSSVQDKGISIQRLTEIFWFSMDQKSAKNNRAVNIAKLKNILAEIEGCYVSRKTGYWQIGFNDSIVYSDYWTCKKITGEEVPLSRERLEQFLSITERGPLLGNANYEWLDEFKSDCSNLIIDTLMNYRDQCKIENDCELMIRLADTILVFDILHEEAIGLKCKALTALGKHTLAKNAFTKFEKDYQKLYDEPFGKSFSDLIKS